MEDLLCCIQRDYSNFCDKEYVFYLENSININLKCKKENLPHLIGLHKLKSDYSVIRQMVDKNDYSITPKNIFDILNEKNITYNDFAQCASWTTHLKDRMENFTYENVDSILRKTGMFTFIYDPKKTKNSKAKYVLMDKKSNLFVHLYIGYDEKAKHYYPNSYVADKEKDSNLSRDTIKIIKTEIYSLSKTGKVLIEVIEHAKIREIKTSIKDYNKKNKELYKQIRNGNSNADNLLNDINALVKEIVSKYNELNSCNDDDLNNKIKLFLE